MRFGRIAVFLLAVLTAALAPILAGTREPTLAGGENFPGWPVRYEDRDLTAMALTPRETAFVRDFPGRVGRFSDGRREIIIRWVNAPTRRLHPAADCFRASGYRVTPLPAQKNADGRTMSCFRASLRGDRLRICELIRDEGGESWPDVSAWYWSAMLGTGQGPWWSFVVAQNE
jgi:hypothetical protein